MQMFLITYASEGAYTITPFCSGNVLDVSVGSSDNVANVQQFAANGTSDQRFVLKPVYSLRTIASSLDSSLVLDVEAGSTTSGANIQLYKRNGTKAQMFYVTDFTSNGARYIIPASGACMSLDAADG